jgi:hypothetical protein
MGGSTAAEQRKAGAAAVRSEAERKTDPSCGTQTVASAQQLGQMLIKRSSRVLSCSILLVRTSSSERCWSAPGEAGSNKAGQSNSLAPAKRDDLRFDYIAEAPRLGQSFAHSLVPARLDWLPMADDGLHVAMFLRLGRVHSSH